MKKNILIIIIIFVIGLGGFVIYDNKILDNNKKEVKGEKDYYNISYKTEEYITKNSKGFQISKSIRNFPVITSDKYQNAANKIINSLTIISDKEWNENVKSTADQMTQMDSDEDMDLGVQYLFNTVFLNKRIVSFNLTMEGSFGGVKWSTINGYNYKIKNGSELEFDELSENITSLKEACYNHLVDYIKENTLSLEDNQNENWQTLIKEKMFKMGYWHFTNEGIKFVFSKYKIGSGVAGSLMVDVPKDKVNNYLKDEYKIK